MKAEELLKKKIADIKGLPQKYQNALNLEQENLKGQCQAIMEVQGWDIKKANGIIGEDYFAKQ